MADRPVVSRYIVGNPYDLPEGVPILQLRDRAWYEGDEFTPPRGMKPEAIARRIEQGFLMPKDADNG